MTPPRPCSTISAASSAAAPSSKTPKACTHSASTTSRPAPRDRVEDFKQINGELTQRLHDKSYLNAYTYYKIGRYKSAIVSLKNALKQFPDSNHREEIMYMIVDASYRFANNSIANKQTDRYLSMLDSYLSFKEEFPESKYTKEVDRMAKHARDYLDRNKKDEDKDNNI